MCNFAIKIIEIDNEKQKFGFIILDKSEFQLHKYYSTLDRNPVRFYFVKNNNTYYIEMDSKISRRIYKKSMLLMDYCFEFCLKSCIFKISKETNAKIDYTYDDKILNLTKYNLPNHKEQTCLIPPPNIYIGEVLFVHSNLVFDCCG